MLDTADHLEVPARTNPTDTLDSVPPAASAPPADATSSLRLRRMLVGCLAIEAALVVIALVLLIGGRPTPSPETDPSRRDDTPSTGSETVASDASDAFIDAWARSLTQDHHTSGTVTRAALGPETLLTSKWPDPIVEPGGATVTVMPYRHSRLDGRALTQIGDVATVVEPDVGRRTCIRQTGGFACTVGGEAVAESIAAVEHAVGGPGATHRIVAVDPTEVAVDYPQLAGDVECWEARSLTDGLEQRWGRRAQFCFDRRTGAAVFRRVLGMTRIEVLIVDTVSSDVSPADLDPV